MSESGVDVVAESKSLPPLLAALRAIGASALAPPEKALLRALLEWWNHKTGELWPSVPTIAASTGFSLRGVRKILRRLEEIGALALVVASRGGRPGTSARVTQVYRIQFDRFPCRAEVPSSPRERRPRVESRTHRAAPVALTPEPCSGLAAASPAPCSGLERVSPARGSGHEAVGCAPSPEPDDIKPGTCAQPSPEPGSAKHTSHEHTSGTIQAEVAMRDVLHRLEGWVDGQAKDPRDLRVALIRLGVRGPNLDRLSASPALQVEDVLREARDIQRDHSTRNIAAVLVSRLALKAGIELNRRPVLDAKCMGAVAQIEALRRRVRSGACDAAA